MVLYDYEHINHDKKLPFEVSQANLPLENMHLIFESARFCMNYLPAFSLSIISRKTIHALGEERSSNLRLVNSFMKKSLLILTLLLSIENVAGQIQNACTSPPPSVSNVLFLESLNHDSLSSEQLIRIPVTLHIIRRNDGTGGAAIRDILQALCAVNNRFAPLNIQFYLAGPTRLINQTSLTSPVSFNAAADIMGIYNVARTMNVYFTNLSAFGTCAFAFFPGLGPGGAQNQGGVMMGTNCSFLDGALFAHEIGHFFNLPHTFDQTSDDPTDPVFAERVTRNQNELSPRLGANCSTSGDRFCDTPADFLAVRWNCPNTVVRADYNGDIFQPDPSLYMGYPRDSCMSRFSTQQIAAMRATLAGVTAPRGYLLLNPAPATQTITQTPSLLLPGISTPNISINSPSFQWSSVPSANWYAVRILQFGTVVLIDTVVSDTSITLPSSLFRTGRTYIWSVQAIGQTGFCTVPSNTVSFQFSLASSSFENPTRSKVELGPNPAKQNGEIFLYNLIEGNYLITIYDLNLRECAKYRVKPENGTVRLDLRSIIPGQYFVQLSSDVLKKTFLLNIHQ